MMSMCVLLSVQCSNITVMTKFEWDQAKAQSNLKKHRVSFEMATRVFADPFALVEQDRIEHGERRWQTLGTVEGHLLLLVAHTVRDDEDGTELIRIISARRAEPKERKHYAQNCSP
jgi:uncharacterized protein